MIATSLSTRSCTTGLCGQCGPCRRALRADDLILRPKILPPIELSPSVREIMAEDRKANKPARRPVPKVSNRRVSTGSYERPSRANQYAPQPCTDCGQMRSIYTRGNGHTIDGGPGNICAVCRDKPIHLTRLAELATLPVTHKVTCAIGRARRHLERFTKDGRAYHPDAPHGDGTGYTRYGCRCVDCRAWRTAYTDSRR
ncbi:hypothetical protein B2J88_07955 [Rhodococcus sp. SRB_17]|nr:hypothetical protein [Rhodococcus sp. SRB_17]